MTDSGFILGHIGITVPDVNTACERFEKLGVEFIKKPDGGKYELKYMYNIIQMDGKMKSIIQLINCICKRSYVANFFLFDHSFH